MALIHVFEGLGTAHETHSFCGRISDCLRLDFDSYIILRAGKRLSPDSIVGPDDIIYVRRVPSGVAAVVVAAAVAVTVAVGVGVYAYKKTKAMMKSMQNLQDNQKLGGTKSAGNSSIQKLPWVKGASNQYATGQTFPYIIGDTLFTPYKLCPDHIEIRGTDGKDSYYYLVLEAGFAPLRIRELKIGTNVVKTFGEQSAQNGIFQFDKGNFYDPENIIEIAQTGAFRTDGFEKKILMTEYMEEIPHRYESGSAEEISKIKTEWQTGLVKELAGNAMSAEVIILLDGLTWFNGNSGTWQNTSVTIQVQWTNVDNPQESDWRNFDRGFRQGNSFSNTITRNSKVQMRFSAVQDFTAGQSYGKNISIRVRRTTQERESNGREAVYLLAVQTTCFDYAKSSSTELVPAVPLEPDLRDKCTRIGIKVKSSAVTDGKLDRISIIVTGCCRVWDAKFGKWSSEKVPSRNLAAWVLEILTSSIHRPSRYDDSEIDLDSFGAWYEYCEKSGIYADGAISQSATKQSTIDTLVANGNAALVMNEMTGKMEVYIDNGRDYSVALLTPDNILNLTAVKQIKRLADGVRVTYVNRKADFDTDSVTFMRSGKEYDPATDSLSPISLSFITDYDQAFKYAWRKMAEEIARPLTATVKVGAEGVFYSLFDCVQLQHPVLSIGLAHGVIRGLSWENGRLASIELFGTVEFPESMEAGIIVECSQTGGILALRCLGRGRTSRLRLGDFVSDSDRIRPFEGDTLSFGLLTEEGGFDLVSTKMLITGMEPADEGATLVLTEYNEAVYQYGDLPVYRSNITPVPESTLLTLGDVRKYVDPTDLKAAVGELSAGTAQMDSPDDISLLKAVAERDSIALYWPPLGLGLKNTVQFYSVEYSTDGGSEWTFAGVSKTNSMNFAIDREKFGYPEAEDFASWRFRVRATSVCNRESEGWTESAVDVTGYGTWKLQPPAIHTRISDRTITLMLSQPARGDGRLVYGTVTYRVQVKRPDVDEKYYRPSVDKDPEGAEDNYKDGDGFAETEGVYVQTMPLRGQGNNDIVDTAYMFSVCASNEAGTGGCSETTATALCTNIKDIVRANETAKKSYITQLSALCANMGAIFQGAMGRNNNLWDLSTFIDDYGVQHHEGHFRVGGDGEFIEVEPVVDGQGNFINYHVHFVAGSFDVSAEATVINGEVLVQENAGSLDRARISPEGLFFERRASANSKWRTTGKHTSDELTTSFLHGDGALTITNSGSDRMAQLGNDIGRLPLSEHARVYHFNGSLLDQNGGCDLSGHFYRDGKVHSIPRSLPDFKGSDDSTGERNFSPAVSDGGMSLYGPVSLTCEIGAAKCWTVDFWVNLMPDRAGCYARFGGTKESVSFVYASKAEYCTEGYCDEADPYWDVLPAGWYAVHHSGMRHEYVPLPKPEGWTHVACVREPDSFRFMAGSSSISFDCPSMDEEPSYFTFNEVEENLLIDELMVDGTVAESPEDFAEATAQRIPWGSLDWRKKWLVIDAEDPSLFRSNAISMLARKIAQDVAHPVGSRYVQFSDAPDPADLYGFGTWEDISQSFDSSYLRVLGEASAAFGEIQQEGLPNISGAMDHIQSERGYNTGASGAFAASNYTGQSDGGSGHDHAHSFDFYASRSNAIYGRSSHVTPQSSAVRIWKRTE